METLSQFIINRLHKMGLQHSFGVPGDYILDFYHQVTNSKKIELIGTTTEQAAGYAADAYARVNGIGCCVVTYCVGGLNLVSAIGGAYAEKSPVVVISGSPGMQEREQDLLLHHMVRTFECQRDIFAKVTCAHTVLDNPSLACYEIDRVLDACKYYKQPVYIELPRDIINKQVNYDPWNVGTPPATVTTDPTNLAEMLEETLNWLNEAKNPVILAGVEIARYGYGKDLMKFAEQNNIPVATTLLGKSVVSERHPLSLGVYCAGLSGEKVNHIIDESDCILMLGVLMTDVNLGFMPVRIRRRNAVISTCADAQIRNHTYKKVAFNEFFKALIKSKTNRRQAILKAKPVSASYVVEDSTKQITATRVFAKISSMLADSEDDNMVIVADVGDSMFGAAEIEVNTHQFIAPAFYTGMGYSIPAALGVQSANRKLRPIVIVGDGAFQMTGMELSTIVRRGYNPIVFVLNNGGYLTERLIKDGTYNDIQNWRFDLIPQVIGGGTGMEVRTEGELDTACAKAMSSNEAFVINIYLDKKDATPALQRMMGTIANLKK